MGKKDHSEDTAVYGRGIIKLILCVCVCGVGGVGDGKD